MSNLRDAPIGRVAHAQETLTAAPAPWPATRRSRLGLRTVSRCPRLHRFVRTNEAADELAVDLRREPLQLDILDRKELLRVLGAVHARDLDGGALEARRSELGQVVRFGERAGDAADPEFHAA